MLGQMGDNIDLQKLYAAIFEIFIFSVFCPFLGHILAVFAKNGQKMA